MVDASPLIRVRNLSKTYRKKFRALDGISLEVGRGSVFGLLGPNGAGKTTLIKVLLGLARKSGGDADLFGEPIGDPRVRERIGYLPEAHRLPPYLTGRKVLQLFGQMCGRDAAWVRQRVPPLIELVGMRDAVDRKVREYSKGMQQRIGLAAALIHEPELIFLDEPTDGVDPIGRAAVRTIVQSLKAKGVTVFINSHLLMEVEMICDRVVIMAKGKILREGTIAELTPRTGRVRVELASIPENLDQIVGGLGSNFVRHATGFEVQLTDAELDQCIDRLRAANVSIRGLVAQRVNLEQAFIQLVQEQRK
jgi:ABC-2 type transport system ATP-binding protein